MLFGIFSNLGYNLETNLLKINWNTFCNNILFGLVDFTYVSIKNTAYYERNLENTVIDLASIYKETFHPLKKHKKVGSKLFLVFDKLVDAMIPKLYLFIVNNNQKIEYFFDIFSILSILDCTRPQVTKKFA